MLRSLLSEARRLSLLGLRMSARAYKGFDPGPPRVFHEASPSDGRPRHESEAMLHGCDSVEATCCQLHHG